MEKREVGLTFAASCGEFTDRNNIETYYMAAYAEFPPTTACEILITFCAYVAKTQSVSDYHLNILTLNNMRCEQWQGPALSHICKYGHKIKVYSSKLCHCTPANG